MAGRLAAVVIWLTRGRPIAPSMRQALDKLERPPTSDR
jgi:hypothetical protein